LRDDRLFIIACDDTYAPKQYFEFFRIPRVQVHVVPTANGTSAAPYVLERLTNIEHEEDDERWMLLDCDHYTQGPHLRTFLSALTEAERQGVNVALSKPSFELWLLLHHLGESSVISLADAAAVEAALRAQLGQYNKTNVKKADFPLDVVPKAYERARRLDQTVTGGQIPTSNTTRVYQLWKAIATKALPSQLPSELQSLIDS
jgi:hypothetical protein